MLSVLKKKVVTLEIRFIVNPVHYNTFAAQTVEPIKKPSHRISYTYMLVDFCFSVKLFDNHGLHYTTLAYQKIVACAVVHEN